MQFFFTLLSVSVLLFNVPCAADVLTQRNNNGRTGSTNDTIDENVFDSQHQWGVVPHKLDIAGRVYAQPLYISGVMTSAGKKQNLVVVASDRNFVGAYDANTFKIIWTRSFEPNDKSRMKSVGCDGLSPDGLGVEATPVIDRAHNSIIATYRTNSSGDPPTAKIMLVALDLGSGRTISSVQVSPPNFDVSFHRSRASLLLSGGVVYVGIGSRCEELPKKEQQYHGYVLAYDAASLQPVGCYRLTAPDGACDANSSHDTAGAGIWQASTGLAADEEGNIYFSTGNRPFMNVKPPFAKVSPVDGLSADEPSFADSVIKLTPTRVTDNRSNSTNYRVVLKIQDWFTPYRKLWMDAIDLDLGSAGVVVLPGSRYLWAGGKQGVVYALDRNDMGRVDQTHKLNASAVFGKLGSSSLDEPEDFRADSKSHKIQAGINQFIPTPVPGGDVVASERSSNADQILEAFGIGEEGAVWIDYAVNDGPWLDGQAGRNDGPIEITAPGFVPPNAKVAVVSRPIDTVQEDLFVVGNDGAIWTTWVSGADAWKAAVPITPSQLAPPGAAVSAIVRHQKPTQEDVFFVDVKGVVSTIFVVEKGQWSTPVQLSQGVLCLPGSPVAAVKRDAHQEDIFYVDKDGAVYTQWVIDDGLWSAPTRLTEDKFADPKSPITALVRHANPLQEDIFLVDVHGQIQTLWVIGNSGWNHTALGPISLAHPKTPIAAVKVSDKREEIFLADAHGKIIRMSESDDKAWIGPESLSAENTLPPGAGIAAMRRRSGQLDLFGISASGHLLTKWQANNQVWSEEFALRTGVPMDNWFSWPHIHGTPVFGDLGNDRTMMYIWPEKDHLKAFPWKGDHFDVSAKLLGRAKDGRLWLAPPDNGTGARGMPGGMLSLTVDEGKPGTGVLFASVPRQDDQTKGVLIAFDPLTLKELWNNLQDHYCFAKFVPPTIADGKVFLATCDQGVLVYGMAHN